jgi:hypothetical protein
MVSFAARAVGTTFCPACSSATRVSVAMASISGTINRAFPVQSARAGFAVQHIDDVRTVCDLHGRGVG